MNECERALIELKNYFSNPPLLSELKPKKELFLYLTISPIAMSAALIREHGGAQLLVYYINHVRVLAEIKYPNIKKLALTLLISS